MPFAATRDCYSAQALEPAPLKTATPSYLSSRKRKPPQLATPSCHWDFQPPSPSPGDWNRRTSDQLVTSRQPLFWHRGSSDPTSKPSNTLGMTRENLSSQGKALPAPYGPRLAWGHSGSHAGTR